MGSFHLPSPKVRRRLIGVAVAVTVVWGFFQVMVTHITDCGFDANGAYAKVRVSLLGAQEVWVDFYLDGRQYAYDGRYNVRGTTVLRAPFPPQYSDHAGHTLTCKFDHTDPD
jgi:hypothetical protein